MHLSEGSFKQEVVFDKPIIMKKNITGLLLFVFSFFTANLFAQTSPDAGSVRQEVEKNRPANELQKKAPPEIGEKTEDTTRADKGPLITVSSFHFSGNTLLTTAQLNVAVVGYLNRPLGFGELQKAAVAIAEAYRKAGWIVRAYLPVQAIGNGVVNIAIVEAV